MPSSTNELALERAIEQALTGTCLEAQAPGLTEERPAGGLPPSLGTDPQATYGAGAGYLLGDPGDFDATYALDTRRFWHFLETTQPEELAKLQRAPDWKLKILQRYDRMVKKYGLLRLLRQGLAVEDAHLTLFYQLPMASSSPEVKARFAQNAFSVTRQVHFHPDEPRQSIDMVIFLNGLPIATLELKNPWTGQSAAVQGIHQYQRRDIRPALLQFGRCLVHMAVDTEEVYMTTRLAGKDTFFLPFNQGYRYGKGNPPSPFGHKTAYLWEEVLRRESLANILQHFVRLDGKPSDPLAKRTLYFPRYHQLDVVRKLLAHAAHHGVGQTYLIQHSAGSGKSNSITWAAYQLIEVYPARADVPGAKGLDSPLFDSVIVVTDRRLLDKQLRENIREFSQVKNIVAPAYSARDLKMSLEQGKKLIITTIQKFPFIVDGIADLRDKRFAVVIDEAHSSQGGVTAGKMNQAMGAGDVEEVVEDSQDQILRAMRARKMKGNASYFAFTATPKNTTLEKFGRKEADGKFYPFHLYSMKQAIEEGFILDVLANYTTYRSYYEIQKSIQDNPRFDTRKAQKRLRAYVERDPHTIGTKAEIMMDHFLHKVVHTRKLKGKAKGMVVTQDIESAIRYYQAIQQILAAHKHPFKVCIAFSGKKTVAGVPYTEAALNGFAEKDTRDRFAQDDYRLLVVANKYLTGFDQPQLCTMYVDKKLQNVFAVQALSRLNRAAPKFGKKTEDLFILDFFNEVDTIKEAFDPFYTATTLSRATDVNVLHELKGNLDEVGVYEQAEVAEFVEQYFAGVEAQALSALIDTAADRFNHELDLSAEEKADFKVKAKQFVKIYGQVASIMEFEVVAWEQLFWFLKFLIPKLVVKSATDKLLDDLLDSVDLSTYGLERTRLNHHIALDAEAHELPPQNPNPRGAHGPDIEVGPLDEIIRTFNERWFQGWEATPEDQRVKLLSLRRHVQAHPDFAAKFAQNPDTLNRDIAFTKIIDDIMAQQRRQELELYKRYAQDEVFRRALLDTLKRMVEPPAGPTSAGP